MLPPCPLQETAVVRFLFRQVVFLSTYQRFAQGEYTPGTHITELQQANDFFHSLKLIYIELPPKVDYLSKPSSAEITTLQFVTPISHPCKPVLEAMEPFSSVHWY